MRYLGNLFSRFFRAIWDFLVDDSPEVLFVTVVVVMVALALRSHRSLGLVTLPLLVVLSLIGLVWFARVRLAQRRSSD